MNFLRKILIKGNLYKALVRSDVTPTQKKGTVRYSEKRVTYVESNICHRPDQQIFLELYSGNNLYEKRQIVRRFLIAIVFQQIKLRGGDNSISSPRNFIKKS